MTEPWEPMSGASFITRRKEQITAVKEAFTMESIHELGLPTTKLDSLSLGEVMDPMRTAIDEVRPDRAYVVHRGDVHTDHRVAFDAA